MKVPYHKGKKSTQQKKIRIIQNFTETKVMKNLQSYSYIIAELEDIFLEHSIKISDPG